MKSVIINDAYSQLRISGLTTDPNPEELTIALNRLENMAHEWAARGICSGYNFQPDPDTGDDLGVERKYWQAYSTNLAIRLMPDFGIQAGQALISQATQSLSAISSDSAKERLNRSQYPDRQPIGSGNRRTRIRRFYPGTVSVNTCTKLCVGNINVYTEDFQAYLTKNEDIDSYTIESEQLSILQDSNTLKEINYEIEAVEPCLCAVKITMNTTLGRITTRFKEFEVLDCATNSIT